MESGDPTYKYARTPITHLDAVAHAFGIPLSYLFIPPDSTPEERVVLAM